VEHLRGRSEKTLSLAGDHLSFPIDDPDLGPRRGGVELQRAAQRTWCFSLGRRLLVRIYLPEVQQLLPRLVILPRYGIRCGGGLRQRDGLSPLLETLSRGRYPVGEHQ
jgi:hypothetical protein